MEESTFVYKSVFLYETVGSLNIKPGGLYVGGTLGGGGHAHEVCRRLGSDKLIGIDRDADAIEMAGKRLLPFQDKATIVRSNYANIKEVLKDSEIKGVDGIYPDLGVSPYQLDTASKGFTYHEGAPLDMRAGQRNNVTAAHIISIYNEMELYRVIRDYGEDSFAKNIVKRIVRVRGGHPIETTGELVEIIKEAIPARVRATRGHPAKRIFQAIRIKYSHELEVLEQSIDTTIDPLNPGGRLSIVTSHSLEGRIVKSWFQLNKNPCICSPDSPVCVCGQRSKGKVVSRKPILPSDEGLEGSSRSKSAKLCIFGRRQSQSEDKILFRLLGYERQQAVRRTGPCRCRLLGSDKGEDKVMAARVQASSGRRNACRNARPVYGNDYIQGSVVPKLGPQGVPRQETRQGKSSGSQSIRSNHRIRRNQGRAIYVDFPYVIMLTTVSVSTLYLCINCLHVQSSIAARMYYVEEIEAELEQLRAEDDAPETSINTSIDLSRIHEIATKELGMVYTGKDQVLLYDKTEGEYVRQYEDIPEY